MGIFDQKIIEVANARELHQAWFDLLTIQFGQDLKKNKKSLDNCNDWERYCSHVKPPYVFSFGWIQNLFPETSKFYTEIVFIED